MMNAWKKCVFGAIVLSGLSLNVFAQSVSVNLKNVTVKDAIKYVQKESGYSFVYISTDLNTKNKVDVKATILKEAVDQILHGQPVSYEIKGKNVVVHKLTNKSDSTAPKRKVKGVVKDETGAPVVGATVRESGSNIFVTKRSQLYSFISSWLRFLYIREYHLKPIVPNIKAENGYFFGYAIFHPRHKN